MNRPKSQISNVFVTSPFDEHYLPSVNNDTFERMDSVTLFKQRFDIAELQQENTLHIFIGMDSGLLANFILELERPADSKYLFVELDDVLELLNIELPKELEKSFIICSFEQLKNYLQEVELNLFIVKEKFKLHYSIAASTNSNNYTQLCHDVNKTLEREYFNNTIGFTQKQFIKRQLENISENLQPAEVLRGTFIGKTSLILGGGPSLDEHYRLD